MSRLFRFMALCLASVLPLSAIAAKNVPPSVSLTAPANGASFSAPATITLSAIASDADGGIAKVEFYRGGTTLIATATTAPYTTTWTNVAPGSYTLTAKATDSRGAATTSSSIAVTVTADINTPPTVTLTAPIPNIRFNAPATITLSADATDPDDAIVAVEFFQGNTSLGLASSAPYTITWGDVPAGSYTLTAHATDSRGATASSSPVAITVAPANLPPLLAITAPAWCGPFEVSSGIDLNVQAVDPDGNVTRVDYYANDMFIGSVSNATPLRDTIDFPLHWSGMSPGTYTVTAYATDNQGASATSAPIAITISPSNQAPQLTLTAPSSGAVFSASAPITLVADASDSDGSIRQVDFYRASIYGGWSWIGTSTVAPYTVVWSGVKSAGQYALHALAFDNVGAQTQSSSVLITVNANAPPSVSLTAPVASSTYFAPATVQLSATAVDSDGGIAKVEFFQGSTLIGTATSAPYIYSWTSVAAGSYTLTAKATDNLGTSTVSAPSAITVNANAPPSVSLTAPVAGSSYFAPATVQLSANATDSDGSIAKVEFFQGGVLVGTATTPPYTYTWTSVVAGSYALTAKATDNLGTSTVSAPSAITVNANAPPSVSLTAPVAGSSYFAPATVQLSANATDSDGSIAKVEFFQGSTLIGTATSAPYTYTWSSVAAGGYSFTAKATDNQGASTISAHIDVTVKGIQITLDTPSNGGSLPGNRALIKGSYQAPPNSGVSVNGVLAAPDSNNFYAEIPMVPGPNSIVATLITQSGQTVSQAITVNSDGTAPTVDIHVDSLEIIYPQKLDFRITNSGNTDATLLQTNGGSSWTVPAESSLTLTYAFPTSGTYPINLTESISGTSKAYRIVVKKALEIDTLLQGVYSGMLDNLKAGGVDAAMHAFNGSAHDEFLAVFTALGPNLPSVVEQLGILDAGSFSSQLAEYALVRDTASGKETFNVYFLRGEDGVWRIDGM